MGKQIVLVIFGGQSTEHEVSCQSTLNVAGSINLEKYDVLLCGITKDGRWILSDSLDKIRDGSWLSGEERIWLLPDAGEQSALIREADGSVRLRKIDLAFPVLHGKFGEDGTIQGLLELARIPYVGCGVLASAVSMDKLYTKRLVREALAPLSVRQADFLAFFAREDRDRESCARRVEEAFSYPVFVKPANAGSSCGVTKAHDRKELLEGLEKAFGVDRTVLVEETIIGREVETAVFLGADGEIRVSGVGEILAAADFYDYDAKYNNPRSMTVIRADIPETYKEQIRAAAKAVFRAVDGYGLSRVDFFLTKEGPVFNEINTMPGFTAISMYPKLWEDCGIALPELVQNLIDSAFTRPGYES